MSTVSDPSAGNETEPKPTRTTLREMPREAPRFTKHSRTTAARATQQLKMGKNGSP